MTDNEFGLYSSAVVSRLKVLKKKLKELKALVYETPAPINLIEFLLEDIATKLGSIIKRCKDQWKLGRDQDGIVAKLGNVDIVIGVLYSYIRWIESSASTHVHGPLVKAFLMLVRDNVGLSEEQILVRTRWNYGFNYQNATEVSIKPVFPEILKREIPEWKRFYLVSYPRIEKDNAFILSNLAHEVGHIFDEKHGSVVNGIFKYKSEILGTDVAYEEARKLLFGGDTNNKEVQELGQELLDLLREQAKQEARPDLFRQPDQVARWRADDLLEEKFKILPRWLIECFADIAAARILPIPFLFSLAETLHTYKPGRDYPPNEERLRLVIEEIDNMGLTENLRQLSSDKKYGHTAQIILQKIEEYRTQQVVWPSGNRIEEIVPQIAWAAVKEALTPVREFIRGEIPPPSDDLEALFEQVELLRHGIPPNSTLQVKGAPPNIFNIRQILSIGWLFWLSPDIQKEKGYDYPFQGESREKIKPQVSNLLLKAVESSSVQESYRNWREKLAKKNPKAELKYDLFKSKKSKIEAQGALSRVNMVEWMNRPISKALVATPLLDPEQIGESSLDVRLGNVFITFKRARFSELKLSRPDVSIEFLKPEDKEKYTPRTRNEEDDPQRVIDENSERVRLCYGKSFVLHPDEFVLASTLEYLRVPTDLMAYVAGKSSLGRLGLVIATATQIAPGFKGVLTLELANVGTVPIRLFPGIRIAQIIFHPVAGIDPSEGGYKGSYSLSTEPAPSGIYEKDIDLEFLEHLDKSP